METEFNELKIAHAAELDRVAGEWRSRFNQLRERANTRMEESKKMVQAKDIEVEGKNTEIEGKNIQIEAQNARIQALQAEKDKLDEELKLATEKYTKAEAARDQHLKRARELVREIVCILNKDMLSKLIENSNY